MTSTKNQLDLNLALTKKNIDYEKLQEATSVISKIASVNPLFYGILLGANSLSNGASNKYLNGNSQSQNNPLFESLTSMLGFGGNNDKVLEQPSLDFSKINELKPLPYTFDSQYDSKYSFLDTQQSTYNKSDNNQTNNLQYIIPIVVGSGMLLFIVSRKKV